MFLSNITLSIFDHHLYNVVQWRFSSTYFKHSYITIIFGVTVVNEDRTSGKTKVGVQIVVKRWQEKAAAHPSFLSDAQAGINSKNNNDNFMRKSR